MNMGDWIKTWLKAARAPFLVVSVIPSLLGGAIAYYHGSFDWLIFVVATIGVVMAHSAADFIDDYFDYKTGNLGNKEKQFHDSPLIDQKVTLKGVMIATISCLVISISSGIFLLIKVGMPVVVMTIIGGFIVLFYTSPPIRLNYRGLGETMLFIAFGPLTVFGVYYVLTGHFSIEPLLASIPLGIFTMNVGLVSNTFDYLDDVESGKKCIPVRFGQANAVRLLIVVSIIAFIAIPLGSIFKIMPYWTLIGILTLPLGYGVIKATKLYEDTANYTKAMSNAIALSSVTGLLLCGAYIVEIIMK